MKRLQKFNPPFRQGHKTGPIGAIMRPPFKKGVRMKRGIIQALIAAVLMLQVTPVATASNAKVHYDLLAGAPCRSTYRIPAKFRVNYRLERQIINKVCKLPSNTFPTRDDVLAVMLVESGFRPNPHQPLSSARGLMQVLRGPVAVEQNIDAGVALLTEYYRVTGSRDLAIQAYNIGPGAVKAGRRAHHYLRKHKKALAEIRKSKIIHGK